MGVWACACCRNATRIDACCAIASSMMSRNFCGSLRSGCPPKSFIPAIKGRRLSAMEEGPLSPVSGCLIWKEGLCHLSVAVWYGRRAFVTWCRPEKRLPYQSVVIGDAVDYVAVLAAGEQHGAQVFA